MSSEICFNLDQSKILPSGNGLKCKQSFSFRTFHCIELQHATRGGYKMAYHLPKNGTSDPTILQTNMLGDFLVLLTRLTCHIPLASCPRQTHIL